MQESGFLLERGLREVAEHAREGHLCVLPSDSAYVLTGLPHLASVTSAIDLLLQRSGLEISLAFGSLAMAREYVNLSHRAEDFLSAFMPGPLTFVASPRSPADAGLSRGRLHADGSVGVRLTESIVETQLCNALGSPLPTTPVRDASRELLYDADAATATVLSRMDSADARPLAVIEGSVKYPGRLSTVVREVVDARAPRLRVLREEAISVAAIQAVASEYGYGTVERA